jgi:RNA polymerase sigma factor (sigma-70 family)
MASSPMSAFLDRLRRAALRRDEAGLSDGQLLDAYIRDRDEVAFAALVQRHGPMVWGVCRRVLGNDSDAEDAFQAAFLVLVRKAASIVPRDMVANWLYGVARQTAVKAKAMAVKRKTREKQVEAMPEPIGAEQGGRDDLLLLLDLELSRLPDKYRTAIVLCDLEGKKLKEAARQLGCPEGTLAARLARGRAMVAKRLARHGLAVTGGVLATVLSQSASAGVPAPVVSSTIKAAALFAVGQAAAMGAISVKVVALTEGVLKTMLMTKLKIATAMVLVVFAFATGGFGISLFKQSTLAAAQNEGEKDVPKAPSAKKGEGPKTDRERLQGSWEFVSVSQGDMTVTKKNLPNPAVWKSITVNGDKMKWVCFNGDGKEVEFHECFKLDATRRPKTIDLLPKDRDSKGDPMWGLYELDGDVLKLCIWDMMPPYPKAFDSKDEAVTMRKYLLTFKRSAK